MKRGDLVTVALQEDYGKPRPALVIQSDFFHLHPSVTILPIMSCIVDAPLFRFTLEPSEVNGLQCTSQVMADKIVTVSRSKVSETFGKVTAREIIEIDRMLALFLGLA